MGRSARGRLRLPIGRLSCINVVIGCCEQNNTADRVFFANHAIIMYMKAILNPRGLDHPYQGHQHGSGRLRIEPYKNTAMKGRSDKRYPSVLTCVLCSCPGNYAGNKPFSGVIWVGSGGKTHTGLHRISVFCSESSFSLGQT